MGMSASQARFLSLTARKTNVEYEGQQINQQRTTLSNESSNYYSQLASMSVPTPPSSADYTKVTYTFQDGTEKNTITSLIAQKDGFYKLNYVQKTPTDDMIANGTNVISRVKNEDGVTYYVGSNVLRKSMPSTQTNVNDIVVTDDTRSMLSLNIPESVVDKMSDQEIKNLLAIEAQYTAMLDEKYGEQDWYVRYQKNSSSGAYEPIFYGGNELANADYDEKTTMSLSGIKNYVYGETTKSQEIRNVDAKVEQDSSGRFISLIIYDDKTGTGTTYSLTTTTESDEAAYNDAMNQYYYDKAQYDKKIQEVNSKIEIIQVQDKNLELKLKQLDTEESAISTEMDAVKKVISKNVESSFKTFNA